MNKVFLRGNLTRDPELKYTQSGKAYVRGSIAVNHARSKNKEAEFYTFIAWEKTAEFLAKYFRKGTCLIIEGHLQTSKYKNKDGVEVSTVDVVVENVEFGGGRKTDGDKEFPNSTPIDDDDIPFV